MWIVRIFERNNGASYTTDSVWIINHSEVKPLALFRDLVFQLQMYDQSTSPAKYYYAELPEKEYGNYVADQMETVPYNSVIPRCECGSDAVGSPRHSSWCPITQDPFSS